MLQAWQKRLLDNRPTVRYEFTSGTHELELPSGQYEITLIGAGGLSAYQSHIISARPTILYEYFAAQGGIGGTAIARLNVAGTSTISIHVGERNADIDTYITGIEGFTLRAGGGTNGIVNSYTSGKAGVMGENTMEGAFLSLVSNPITVESRTSYSSRASALPLRFLTLANPNYEPDTTKGSAGASNATGFVLIRSI